MHGDMKKQVNVLVSTYNGEAYIRAQLDSILNQSYENVRIYVRDDGSTDQTLPILKEYEAAGDIVLSAGGNIG
jgi:glycosyltransferase involved in cell wall biosynthesis